MLEVKESRAFASVTLVWLRRDLPRDRALDYWRSTHGSIVVRNPALGAYRQHHFADDEQSLWPSIPGVETQLPRSGRIDGMPEVALRSVGAAVLSARHNSLIQRDEANVFHRTIMYLTRPNGAYWFDRDVKPEVLSRCVVLLRKRTGCSARSFRLFIERELTQTLIRSPQVAELRTMIFLPGTHLLWNHRCVAHDVSPALRFHAAVVVGTHRDRLAATLQSAATSLNADSQLRHVAAIHAYPVAHTYQLL